MIATPDLIDTLSRNLMPVQRLRPPGLRALFWLLLGLVVLALLGVVQGIRPDIATSLREPVFVTGLTGALLTGVLASVAAFILSLPDRSRLWLLLPVPSLAAWLSTIGYQCLTHWVSLSPDGMRFGETMRCFATLVLTGLPLSLAMLLMLRHAAPLRPAACAISGCVAVAAITAFALSLFHTVDATVMILFWNVGLTGLYVGFGWLFRGRLFSRVGLQRGVDGL